MDSILVGTPSSDDEEEDLESSSEFEEVLREEPEHSSEHRNPKGSDPPNKVDGEENEDVSEVEEEFDKDGVEESHESEEEGWGESSDDQDEEEIVVLEKLTEPATEPKKTTSESSAAEMIQSSQPLQTLEKLRQMLDETDYITESPNHRTEEYVPPSVHDTPWTDATTVMENKTEKDNTASQQEGVLESRTEEINTAPQKERLWTSKDRLKYKKQQERLRRAKKEQRRLEQQLRSPPLHPNSSDDDITDEESDDGLGYTLPNLPVYYSDTEGTTDLTDSEPPQNVAQQERPPPPPPFAQRQPYQYPEQNYHQYSGQPPPQQMGPIPPYMGYPPNTYNPYGPYGPPYSPQQQQPYSLQQQQQIYASQYAAWAASTGAAPYGTVPPYSSHYQAPVPRRTEIRKLEPPLPVERQTQPVTAEGTSGKSTVPLSRENSFPLSASFPLDPATQVTLTTPQEITPHFNFDSMQKMSIIAIGLALLAYCSVSPRTLAQGPYVAEFLHNIRLISLTLIAPIITFSLVFDTRENDLNDATSTMYTSFTTGYILAFVLEIIFTTLIRLGVFAWWEPDALKLSPKVPSLVLPWVLRENGYRPKRITLFVADFATSCVAAPIVEEYVKLKVLQLSVRLPRNFRWTTKVSSKKKKKKKRPHAEPIPRNLGESQVTNINSYVIQMLAASFGIKLCDSARRILMYTKASNEDKEFYAFCRGVFPIHELCGTMTALALAKRDVLGVHMPLWKMLFPAVFIHGMANFRGMKPIFKWNSSTPWSEMQLSPLSTAATESLTLAQALNKAFPKIMWAIILFRVLGYCIKNYYLIGRQATKRTTTYAGKHSAFSAELAADEMLRKTKEK